MAKVAQYTCRKAALTGCVTVCSILLTIELMCCVRISSDLDGSFRKTRICPGLSKEIRKPHHFVIAWVHDSTLYAFESWDGKVAWRTICDVTCQNTTKNAMI